MRYRDLLLFRGNEDYSAWERALGLAALAVYCTIVALLGHDVWIGAVTMLDGHMAGGELGLWAMLVFVPLAACVAADVVSGVVHCAADNIGSESTPVLGQAFIRPFREHHRDPLAITRHGFVDTNGNNCLVNLLVLVPTYVFAPVTTSALGLAWGMFMVFFTLAIALTNQVHKWAHMETPPPFAVVMQRWNIILPKSVHQIHHTPPFDRYYCITNGWMNPVLERLGVFDALVRTFGKRP
jgi:hypothetical protein